MSTHTFAVGEALSYGWNTFKKNWQFLVTVFVIVIVIGMIPNYLHDWSHDHLPAITFLFSIIGWVIQMVTGIGVIVISLKFVDGKKPEIKDIYSHYPLLLNYFFGSLIYGIVFLAGIILLIVPGIIWGIKYQYTTYLIIDKKMSPMDAFKKSAEITKGNIMKLLWLDIAFIWITVLGALVMGIGLIVAWPIVTLAGAYVYRKLSPKK